MNSRWAPKHNDHVFDIDIRNMVFFEEEQHIMDIIDQSSQKLYILTGIMGSDKTFFVKYIAQYL